MMNTPRPTNVVLVAALGALLAIIIAWQTYVPLTPASLHLTSFGLAFIAVAVISVFLHATAPGNRILQYLSDTRDGQLFVLLVGAAIIVIFRGVHQYAYVAELASGILGASLGSLIRLLLD